MIYTGGAPYRRIKPYHCFFRRAPIIQGQVTFLQGIWSDVKKLQSILKINKINKINQEAGFMVLSTLKLLYTGCSTKGVMSLLLS